MRITNLEHGQLTVTLLPEDCAAIARYLRAAEKAGAFDEQGQEREHAQCTTLACFFATAAIACVSSSWISAKDMDGMVEDLYLLGLGEVVGIDDAKKAMLLQVHNAVKYAP